MRHFKKRSQMENKRLELNIDNKPSKRGNRNRKYGEDIKFIKFNMGGFERL